MYREEVSAAPYPDRQGLDFVSFHFMQQLREKVK
jgi:hypothetical protein